MKINAWLFIEAGKSGFQFPYLGIEIETEKGKGWKKIQLTKADFDKLKAMGLEVRR